jgi:hypothetical protein
MNQMNTDEEKILAVLHDAIEDEIYYNGSLVTIGYLHSLNFPEDILLELNVLTHNKEEDYISIYVKRISFYKRATKVKKADLEHNSNITRNKGLTKKDFDRLEKYHTAYTYLSKI